MSSVRLERSGSAGPGDFYLLNAFFAEGPSPPELVAGYFFDQRDESSMSLALPLHHTDRSEDVMAKRRQESGEERQQRIQREQHRPAQHRGYDEAVRGGTSVAHDRADRSVPLSGEDTQRQNTTEDVDDRESRLTREQVRREDQSTSRRDGREP
jgi:hypothetical protein